MRMFDSTPRLNANLPCTMQEITPGADKTMDEHIAAIDFKKRKRNKDATWPNEATWPQSEPYID
jgi:hypothetical protein